MQGFSGILASRVPGGPAGGQEEVELPGGCQRLSAFCLTFYIVIVIIFAAFMQCFD